MTDLNKAVVLVTGATGGFGQELTQLLLAAGSQVICTDLDAALLEQQAQTLKGHATEGELLPSITANLATSEGCHSLFEQVKALNLPIDVLINNAGVAVYGRMDETPTDRWETMMQVNLLAPMRLSSLFMVDMMARRRGHIVNISSVAGWAATAGLTHYSTSKFGLRGFSEGLRNDVKAFNVRVTTVYPFFSRTPILRSDSFGTLAQGNSNWPDWLTTDPRKVMQATLQGIKGNQAEIFPDMAAKVLTRLHRYVPGLMRWSGDVISQQLQRQSKHSS
ncbi:MAG: SDR family NAD(P)-dependent oxidoreductase [Thermosynechococcaceae cyanobacterium]